MLKRLSQVTENDSTITLAVEAKVRITESLASKHL